MRDWKIKIADWLFFNPVSTRFAERLTTYLVTRGSFEKRYTAEKRLLSNIRRKCDLFKKKSEKLLRKVRAQKKSMLVSSRKNRIELGILQSKIADMELVHQRERLSIREKDGVIERLESAISDTQIGNKRLIADHLEYQKSATLRLEKQENTIEVLQRQNAEMKLAGNESIVLLEERTRENERLSSALQDTVLLRDEVGELSAICAAHIRSIKGLQRDLLSREKIIEILRRQKTNLTSVHDRQSINYRDSLAENKRLAEIKDAHEIRERETSDKYRDSLAENKRLAEINDAHEIRERETSDKYRDSLAENRRLAEIIDAHKIREREISELAARLAAHEEFSKELRSEISAHENTLAVYTQSMKEMQSDLASRDKIIAVLRRQKMNLILVRDSQSIEYKTIFAENRRLTEIERAHKLRESENSKLAEQLVIHEKFSRKLQSDILAHERTQGILRRQKMELSLSRDHYARKSEEHVLAYKQSMSASKQAQGLPEKSETSKNTPPEAERLIKALTKEVVVQKKSAVLLREQKAYLKESRDKVSALNHAYKKQLNDLAKQTNFLDKKTDLIDRVSRGEDFVASTLTFVRSSYSTSNRFVLRAFCHKLVSEPLTRQIGLLACGVYYVFDNFMQTSLAYFRKAGVDNAKALAPVEYFDATLSADVKTAKFELDVYMADMPKTAYDLHLKLLILLAKYRQLDELNEKIEAFVSLLPSDHLLSSDDKVQLDWMHRLLLTDRAPAPRVPGAVNIGLLDYNLLDVHQTLANRGDHVQTLAVLANICRFSKVKFVKGNFLGEYSSKIQKLVVSSQRLQHVAAKVQIVPVDRDFASLRQYDAPTWTICSGSFMRRSLNGDFDFPYPQSIRPLFISFHLQDSALLTPKTIFYLKRFEPIGCRDWLTLYRLRDFGIKAFFSGCLTTTLWQIFASHKDGESNKKLAVVDAEVDSEQYADWEVTSYSDGEGVIPEQPLSQKLEATRNALDAYVKCDRVVTSKLHTCLTSLSVGIDVDFQVKNGSDIGWEGLVDLSRSDLLKMRTGLEDKLASVLRRIINGASEKDVYEHWAAICQDDVAYADQYAQNLNKLPPPSFDILKLCKSLASGVHEIIPEDGLKGNVNVAFAVDGNLSKMLPIAMASLYQNAKSRLTAHILTRDLPTSFSDDLARSFPYLHIKHYDFSAVDYGNKIKMLSHTTVSTMDRLLLPELLNGVDKVLYLDVDLILQADVTEIYDIELEDFAFAGKQVLSGTGDKLITTPFVHLERTEGWGLRRRLHNEGGMAFSIFNAGVLLMNLNKMREDQFCEKYVPFIENYQFNDQDVLNIYARGNFYRLDPSWNYVPSCEYCETPNIIHWAGQVKPWSDLYILEKEKFHEAKGAVDDAF